MNAVLKFLIGLFAIIAIGVAAMRVQPMPGSAPAAQARLEEKAREALAAENAGWASVEMEGQKAILAGAAPDENARRALIERVAAADGAGGLVAGGVTAVDASDLAVSPSLPIAEPYIFIVEREGDILSFSGNVPDQTTREGLYRLAGELFPDMEISGVLEVAGGAPVRTQDWFSAASASLRALSHLRHGAAEANDGDFFLTGEAEDEIRADAARALLAGLPEGLSGAASIVVRKPPTSIEDIIGQAADDAAVAPAADAQAATDAPPPEEDCAKRLASVINARRIGFTSARADIDGPSRAQLRRVAAVLADCPAVGLSITGHTDSSGAAARNRELSVYRADAVRVFLISVGAPADRITARGVGSSAPIASNETAAGRAQNRRIEFKIVAEE